MVRLETQNPPIGGRFKELMVGNARQMASLDIRLWTGHRSAARFTARWEPLRSLQSAQPTEYRRVGDHHRRNCGQNLVR